MKWFDRSFKFFCVGFLILGGVAPGELYVVDWMGLRRIL